MPHIANTIDTGRCRNLNRPAYKRNEYTLFNARIRTYNEHRHYMYFMHDKHLNHAKLIVLAVIVLLG